MKSLLFTGLTLLAVNANASLVCFAQIPARNFFKIEAPTADRAYTQIAVTMSAGDTRMIPCDDSLTLVEANQTTYSCNDAFGPVTMKVWNENDKTFANFAFLGIVEHLACVNMEDAP